MFKIKILCACLQYIYYFQLLSFRQMALAVVIGLTEMLMTDESCYMLEQTFFQNV